MDFIKIIKKSTYEDLQNRIVMLQAENQVLMDKINGNKWNEGEYCGSCKNSYEVRLTSIIPTTAYRCKLNVPCENYEEKNE